MITETQTQKEVREVRIPTNLNHKLDCDRFVHIGIAGQFGIPGNLLDQIVFRFIVADRSHETVEAHVYDSCRQTLEDLAPYFIELSHNMTKEEFVAKILLTKPEVGPKTEMVTYFYRKIS